MAATPPTPLRYNVLGVGVSALTLPRARDLVMAARFGAPRGYVCVCAVHGISIARADPTLRRIYNTSYLNTPDGMPLVWLGPRGVERVYGPDLMLAVCDAGRAQQLRHYFCGGRPGVAPLLAEKLRTRFPGLVVAGTAAPPSDTLSADELAALQTDIHRTQPDIIWVGFGAPRQERFMAQHWRSFGAGLLVGVGAAFDFHTGRVPQAPRWMQRSGLEWLFRLRTEPRRLAPRYLKTNPLFLVRVAAQKLRLIRYPID